MTKIGVLIVEDEVIVAEDLKVTLSSMGYEVLGVVPDSEAALQMVREKRPDIVLMDIMLRSGQDGVDTAERIISSEDIPVVFLTAYSEQGVLDRAKKAGGAAFLLKPFVPRELDATLQFAFDRFQMLRLLKESEERYRQLFDNVPVGLYSATRDGQILQANPALADILGEKSADRLIGRSIVEFYADPEDREGFLREMEATGMVVNFEVRAVRADGRQCWLQASARAMRASDGKVESYEAFLNDITERRLLEEKRLSMEARTLQEQRDRSILTLAGGVAHQFNNALTVVLGNLELLKMKLTDPEPREVVDQVTRTGQEMANLTRHLLAYAQGGRYLPRTLLLGPLFSRALELALLGKAPDRVQIELDTPDDLWPVTADPEQMIQVFSNLFMNAVECMEAAGGRLTIRAENREIPEPWECPLRQMHASGDYIRVEVADTGPGIPLEFQDRIFEPFFTTRFAGRGLGLAAVMGVIRNHGGCVHLARSDSKGSTFVVLLPRADSAGKPKQEESPSRKDQEPLPDIMVVDDDPVVLNVTRQMLESTGHRVICARDGHEAVTLFRRHRDTISCVLLDVIMPGIHGHVVYREMKQAKPGLHVVVTSGYDKATAIARIALEPGDSFLQKPFSLPMLAKTLQRPGPSVINAEPHG